MSETTTICPFCLVELDKTTGGCTCRRCGRKIDPGKWGVYPYAPEPNNLYSPIGIHGLEPSLDVEGLYLQPELRSGIKGELRTEIACPIDRRKGLRIGSDASCAMTIENAGGPVLGVIVDRNGGKGEPDWWIYDCGGEAGIFVNRKRVLRVRKLVSEDCIDVAGVSLKFVVAEGQDAAILRENKRPDDAKPIIEVKGLTARIDGGRKTVLDGISFSVKQGEFVAVMGPSGCGKSSLIQRIAGLAPYDSGSINIPFGKFVYLPQDVERSLHPSMRLDEEIESYRRIYRIDDPNFAARKKKVLQQLNLISKTEGKDRSTRIGEYSGGEKRRVGLALALLRDPEILLLDEPFAGLDPENERKLTDELYKLAENDNRTIVCVTHGLANKEVFDRLLILGEGGKLRADGSADRLLNLDGLLHPEVTAKSESSRLEKLRSGVRACYEGPCRLLCNLRDDLKSWRREIGRFDFAREREVVSGYWSRYWKENFCKPWHRSNLFVCWVVQPLIIVTGIRLACAYNFAGNNTDVLVFCMALSLFWLGVNNCSRELVRGRVPGRCLERLGGVSTPTYLLSKYLWAMLFCLGQTLAFALVVLLFAQLPLELSQWQESQGAFKLSELTSRLSISPLIILPMFLSCGIGGICGLAVSSIFRTELKATAWATNLAILALLFSDRMVDIKDICVQWIIPVVKSSPCYWPSQWMKTTLDGPWDGGVFWHNVGLFAAYLLLSLLLVCFFEWKNERGWQGRAAE